MWIWKTPLDLTTNTGRVKSPSPISPNHIIGPPDEIESARRIVAAIEAASGGVTVLDGRMIDEPVVAAARRILLITERMNENTV